MHKYAHVVTNSQTDNLKKSAETHRDPDGGVRWTIRLIKCSGRWGVTVRGKTLSGVRVTSYREQLVHPGDG